MSDIEKAKSNEAQVWVKDKQDTIRKLFAPTLNRDEFMFFWGLGKSLQANPFKREIWAVKYDKNKPAQVFLGRDFYRKKAQEQPNFDGHIVDAVYSGDEFKVEQGEPKHSYTLTDRGKLLGAYCTVYRKDITKPFYVYVEFSEYNKGQSTWQEKPATMIKKVAESQALRGAFQGVFAGTYDESESWESGEHSIPAQQVEGREILDIEPEPADEPQGPGPQVDTQQHESREKALAAVNALGKELHGKSWYQASKNYAEMVNPDAENLNDCDAEDLAAIQSELEAEKGAANAN